MGLNETTSRRGHEERDISFGAVVMFVVGLAAMLVIMHFVVVGFFRHLASRPLAYSLPSAVTKTTVQAGPGLVVEQSIDMDKLRVSEEATLNSYGWVERSRGVVHIPIDRAMDMMVETNHGVLK